jgi:RNA methyltransferase, TrmH family
MLTITSSSNPKIKLVRALQTQAQQRKGQGAFVAEGVRLLEDAISAGWPMDYILFDQTLSERGQALLDTLKEQPAPAVFEISPDLMAEISDTETPQGILAVMKSTTLPLPADPSFVIVADQVRDPGNLGTMLRTAEAAGADAVLLTPGTVDAFSPKVVRAGMGAHFHLPIEHKPWHEIHDYLKGLPVFLADSNADLTLWDADLRQPCALLIGGEAFGASSLGEEAATHRITIPMVGRAESLNAAMAASILMAEVIRQRYQRKSEG